MAKLYRLPDPELTFHDHVMFGDMKTVQECLEVEPSFADSLSDNDSGNRSALSLALPYPEMVQLLIAHGADVNVTTPENNTLLHFAVRLLIDFEDGALHDGLMETLAVLINAGARIDLENDAGQTALGLARSSSKTAPALALLERAALAATQPRSAAPARRARRM